jgi:NAD kinase
MIVRTIDGSSVVLSHWTLESKDKIKVVGVARQQLHFLCSDKENEAKESLALRWACLARQGGNINSVKTVELSVYNSPVGPEALESLSFFGSLHLQLQSCF